METEFGEQVRRLRAEREWSLEELADRSGVSRAALSKIERGQHNPRLSTALRIAEALGAPLAQLVAPSAEPIRVVRDGTAPVLVDPETGVIREALLEPYPGTELVRYELPAYAHPDWFPAHEPRTRETFVVIEGALVVSSGGDEIQLAAGDAAALAGDRPHRLRNPGANRTKFLLLIARPRA